MHTPSDVALELNKLECDAITDPERRDELERQKNKYKWICCDSTVTVGSGAGGCKKGKHGYGEQAGDGRRLDQATIRRWEAECQRNQEYIEKWLLLLENRS